MAESEDYSDEDAEERREDAYRHEVDRGKEEKTASLMHTEVKFTTQSILKYGAIKFFSKHGRLISTLFIAVVFLSIFFILMKSVFFESNAADIMVDFENLVRTFGIPIILLFRFIQLLLFDIPETAYPIWFYILATIFFTWLFGRTRDVFGFMYLKGDRKLKLILFPRYFDTAGKQYIGGRASFIYRLFHGNPRYPLHNDYYQHALHQTAELDIIEVANGRNLERQWTGTILIIQTDPTDDIDDDEEVANILLIHDEPIDDAGEEFRRTVRIDDSRIVAFVDFQSMIIGEQLRYRQQYHQLKDELHDAYRTIDDLGIDSATKLARDLTMSPATRARKARGEQNPAEDGLDELEGKFSEQTEELSNL
ncbi:hypothetical protein LCGC14_0194720 [marine sediment metagenome]|uniref:Uncharacterized protein n=1 Tax=marine sediment metagenome TaxID=412755 RepID=A0A0F9UK60_9ZZZZ